MYTYSMYLQSIYRSLSTSLPLPVIGEVGAGVGVGGRVEFPPQGLSPSTPRRMTRSRPMLLVITGPSPAMNP